MKQKGVTMKENKAIKKAKDCKCKISDLRMKCSENGISAYCSNCGKGVKEEINKL